MAKHLLIEPYREQLVRWPVSGRRVIGQFDGGTIVVYQAYNESIGRYAVQHGSFGGDFRFSRMTWIKPGFLWMMYRSGWGTKTNQTTILAIWIRRQGFANLLAQAVPSTHVASRSSNSDQSKRLCVPSVLVQWDPDHDPSGRPLARRVIQLGLRGEALVRYARDWIIDVQDISSFVRQQRDYVQPPEHGKLATPAEGVYPVEIQT